MFAVIAHDVAVRVPRIVAMPAAAVQLHEPDAPLHKPPRQQALAPELLRALVVKPVQRLCRFRFLADVYHFGGMRLHPVAQFIRGDTRFQIAVAGIGAKMLLVQFAQQVQTGPLLFARYALAGSQIENRRSRRAEHGSLIGGGHKAAGPVGRAANRPAPMIGHYDKTGQVLIFAAQAHT